MSEAVKVITLTPDQLEQMFQRAFMFARQHETKILTKSELAKELKVSEATIGRWLAKGMPYFGDGRPRFVLNTVLGWLEKHREPAL